MHETHILPDLESTAKLSPSGFSESLEGRYYLAIKQALADGESGKDFTETMRLLITSLEHNEYVDYTEIPTVEQANRLFMDMWAQQFPHIRDLPQMSLQEYIRSNFTDVSDTPEVKMLSSLSPNNIQEQNMLQQLEDGTRIYARQCKERLLEHRKAWDIAVLYAMMLLAEKLRKKLAEQQTQEHIKIHTDTLLENATEWVRKDEPKEQLNTRIYKYFAQAEKEGHLAQTLADFLNHLYPEIPNQIDTSDLASLELIAQPPELELLNRDTMSHFERFYLKLNLRDFKTIATKLQQPLSGWMNVPFIVDGVETSVIIAPNNPEFLIHELAHSIDPYLGKRVWENAILDECIWYYTSRMYPATITATDGNGEKTEKIKEVTFSYFKTYFYDEMYWKNLGIHEIMTYADYKRLVSNTVDLLEELEKKIGSKWLLTLLLNSKTIQDLRTALP